MAEACHQLEMPKFISGVPTFQNGGHPDLQEPRETRRLDGEGGPKGCILLGPDCLGSQEVLIFFSKRENLSFHLRSLQPDLKHPWVFTKTLKPVAALGRELGFRLVIYIHDILLMAVLKEMAKEQGSTLIHLLQCLGFTINMEKTVTAYSNKEFLGFNVKTLSNGVEPSNREVEKDKGGVPETSGRGARVDIRPRPFQTDRQDECCQPSGSTSSFVLQTLTDGPDRGPKTSRPELRCPPPSVGRDERGASLVGLSDGLLEWEDHPDGVDHRLRRFNSGLGRKMPERRHGWTLVNRRKELAHKLPQTTSTLALKTFVKNRRLSIYCSSWIICQQ